MSIDPRNNLPGTIDGRWSWGGNPVTSFLNGGDPARAVVFYGRNEKKKNIATGKNEMFYTIYTIDIAGVITPILKLGPGVGQGILAIDRGYLILSIHIKTGDAQDAIRLPVPGWIR